MESAHMRQLEDQMARLLVTFDQQHAAYEQRENELQDRQQSDWCRISKGDTIHLCEQAHNAPRSGIP
jgi:hypothetical protein